MIEVCPKDRSQTTKHVDLKACGGSEDGIGEAAKTEAVTRVVAWQLTQEMERQGMTKAALAERMHTSRAQVDRILKAKGNITIETLQRAAGLVGRELRLELV